MDEDYDWLTKIIDPDAANGHRSDQEEFMEEPCFFDESQDQEEADDQSLDLSNSSIIDCNGSDCDSIDEDINSKLSYLTEKRVLLKRASDFMKREEIYDASTSKNLQKDNPAPIWTEAKEMLSLLNRRNTSAFGRTKVVSFTPQSWHKKREAKATLRGRRALINNSTVSNINSKDFKIQAPTEKSLFCEGKSDFVHALHKMQTDSTAQTNIENKPRLMALSNDINVDSIGLVNETSIPTGIPLEEALIITDVPQVIAQATAPYTVIHANRSFMNFADMSFSEVFARSIDEFVKFEKTSLPDAISSLHQSNAVLALIGSKTCEAKLSPVAGSYILIQVSRQNLLNQAAFTHELNHMIATFG
eukprot:CAMPEP_0202458056 /NCGR_PEP_ID=MMETSP1360-20130828/20840_1 /ASSEMBLY_ACC=CAM_ASM_000848 /TAXON_ID=515479 /ORGANISM="Licmophora paradoxa, Strain CCMP2313" /LENGTH=359 /DNA_ID=CAMNT_0049078391 /DNA_START=41 /DNA_END=1120 /DNA_ORIENTATION=-